VIVELLKAGAAEFDRINAAVAALHDRVQGELDNDGIPRDEQKITVVAECRYHGQGFELRAAMPDGPVSADNVHVIADSFHDQHQQDYGYSYRKAEVELITLRAIGSASVRRIEIPAIPPTDGSSIDRALMFVRPTTFDDGRTLETPRYDRTKLYAGDRVPGPALLHQHNATTLVPPGYVAETLDYGNTRIRLIGA
jgi:N-methylhydantoinase A